MRCVVLNSNPSLAVLRPRSRLGILKVAEGVEVVQIVRCVFLHGISTTRRILVEVTFDEIRLQQGPDCR